MSWYLNWSFRGNSGAGNIDTFTAAHLRLADSKKLKPRSTAMIKLMRLTISGLQVEIIQFVRCPKK